MKLLAYRATKSTGAIENSMYIFSLENQTLRPPESVEKGVDIKGRTNKDINTCQ